MIPRSVTRTMTVQKTLDVPAGLLAILEDGDGSHVELTIGELGRDLFEPGAKVNVTFQRWPVLVAA